MFSIYILHSLKTPKTYVGYTSNLNKRLVEHNAGKVSFTKLYKPWKIIHTEDAPSKKDALRRELYWKSGAGRRNLKKILSGFPPNFRKVGRGSPK